jgi:hypothetical protein
MVDDTNTKFRFVPEYADLIASIASGWATIEYYVNHSIWIVAELDAPTGACLTSQIHSLHSKLSSLLSLLKLYQAPDTIIKRVNKFAETIRRPQEHRNRVVHDVWLMDNVNVGSMGRLETTAAKKLEFTVKDVSVEKLRAIYDELSACRLEFYHIRNDIFREQPTFPGIPESERDPIANLR